MTPLEDKLRAALRDTAEEIPAAAPPLRLPAGRQSRSRPGWTGIRPRWPGWTAPLVSAALVVAVIAAAVTIAGGLKHQQNTSAQAGLDGLPPYYVALTAPKPYLTVATAAELRSTQTGTVLAKVVPPKPYVSFTGVTGAADDRTFVLSAMGPDTPPTNLSNQQFRQRYPHGYSPAMRFFLLRVDPPGGMSLQALPAAYTPAGTEVRDMALAPDGTTLAADLGSWAAASHGQLSDHLYAFNLATGTERVWSTRTCARCQPTSGGPASDGRTADALSWTADGSHVAFVWGRTVRLLDIRAPGTDILAASKTVAVWAPGQVIVATWRGAIITPDGRTVLGVEDLIPLRDRVSTLERLVMFSTATGRPTAMINNLDPVKLDGFEEILYTNATGSVFVVTQLRPGRNATILHDGRSTPLPWSLSIAAAAW